MKDADNTVVSFNTALPIWTWVDGPGRITGGMWLVSVIVHTLRTQTFIILWPSQHAFCTYIPGSVFVYVCVCTDGSLEKLTPFGSNLSAQALSLYPSSAPCPTSDRCPERLYSTMVSDMRVTCPNNDLAKRAAGTWIIQCPYSLMPNE